MEFLMHRAAKEGDLEVVRQLIERGVSMDSLDDKGYTPLHWASLEGQHAVAELLISSKCDLNIKDHVGRTPVMLAADWGDDESMRLHAERGSMVTLLLLHGAQVNCTDKCNETLLHFASESGLTDQVKYILDRREADVNAESSDGDTPLMGAASMGHADVAVLLIRAGADVNKRDLYERTALHWAAGNPVGLGEQTQVVQVLLKEEGLDLNPQDDQGWTPLHIACYEGYRAVIMQLLVAGADTTLKNGNGETALSLGIIGRLTLDDIRLLVQHGVFLQECDYAHISQNPFLKESVLKDVSLCTQSIVNKFHGQSLPALKSISYFARELPNVDNFKLNARQVDEVENLVRCEIGRNTFCNVVKAHPIALSALCVLSLITCQSGTKQSASPDLGASN